MAVKMRLHQPGLWPVPVPATSRRRGTNGPGERGEDTHTI